MDFLNLNISLKCDVYISYNFKLFENERIMMCKWGHICRHVTTEGYADFRNGYI